MRIACLTAFCPSWKYSPSAISALNCTPSSQPLCQQAALMLHHVAEMLLQRPDG